MLKKTVSPLNLFLIAIWLIALAVILVTAFSFFSLGVTIGITGIATAITAFILTSTNPEPHRHEVYHTCPSCMKYWKEDITDPVPVSSERVGRGRP